MGGDTQIPGDFRDPIPEPVAAQEQIPVTLVESVQKPVQVFGQFSGIILGFHGRKCGNGTLQFLQRHIVVAVSLLGGVGMIAVQRNISCNLACVGTQMLRLRRRDPVPDMQTGITHALFNILCVVQNIGCHFSHCSAVFEDQFCNGLLRALKEQTHDLLIFQTHHILSVTPIQYGFVGKYLTEFENILSQKKNCVKNQKAEQTAACSARFVFTVAIACRKGKRGKHSGRNLTWDEAYEEMVADSMEAMLTDGNVVQTMTYLKQQDRTLWQKICDWFKNLADDLKELVDAYKGYKPDSPEGRMVADMQDTIVILESIYADALADASENFQRAEKNTTQRGGVKMMSRDKNQNVVVDESVDFEKVREVLTEIYNGNYKSNSNYFPVLKNTPQVYMDYCRLDADRSFVMAKKKAYKAMQHKNKKQHALGVDGLMYVIENLGTPDYIVYQNVGEYAGNYAAIIISEEREIFAAVQLGEYKDAQYAPNGEKGYYNTLITAFYPNEGYLDDNIFIPDNDVVYEKNEDPLQVASGVTPSDRAERSSKHSIRNPGEKVNKKFSMREPFERTKNLVALHNLSADKLRKALELGGFPMPSIAVTKADIPHTNFGEVTLVFGSKTIDPKADRKNTVYSADAWTPTFPRVEYEADETVGRKIYQKLSALDSKIDEFFRYDLRRAKYSYEDNLNRYGGEQEMVKSLFDNYGLKAAFLEEKGTHISAVMIQKETEGISEQAAARYQKIVDILGTTDPDEIGQIPLKEIREKHGEQLEALYPGMTKTALRMGRILNQVRAYLELDGAPASVEMVNDSQATRKAVDDAIDQKEFETWVKELFSGIEKRSGIYNHKPIFTASGNRRTFKQTHLPVTLDNIVKAMAAQNNGNIKNVSGFNGVKTLRAGTAERFKNIDAMHKKEGRLQNLTQEEVDKIVGELQNRCYSVIETIDEENGQRGEQNSLLRFDTIGEILMEVCERGKYNIADIQRVFRENNKEISDSAAIQVKELLYDVAQMPVNLFEAKPERVVGMNEVKAAILPRGTDTSIIDRLQEQGIPIQFYEPGNDAERLQLINAMDDVKFSDRDPAVKRVNEVLQKENARLKEDVRYLKDLVKLQKTVTGGTKFTKSSVEAMAGNLMKANNVKGSKQELAKLLNGLYEYIAKGEDLTWDGVKEMAQPAVDWLRKNTVIKSELSQYAREILHDVRTSRISLDESQTAEAAYRYGSYNGFRKVPGCIQKEQKVDNTFGLFHALSCRFVYLKCRKQQKKKPLKALERGCFSGFPNGTPKGTRYISAPRGRN